MTMKENIIALIAVVLFFMILWNVGVWSASRPDSRYNSMYCEEGGFVASPNLFDGVSRGQNDTHYFKRCCKKDCNSEISQRGDEIYTNCTSLCYMEVFEK